MSGYTRKVYRPGIVEARAQIRSACGTSGLLDAGGCSSRIWGCDLLATVSCFQRGLRVLRCCYLCVPHKLACIFCPLEIFQLTLF